MTAPQVSVMMPVFNGQKYLRPAVESILNQSFRDFEFVIVNDGSTDSTLEILNSYADSRLRVLTKEHQGLIPALNQCVAHSRAPLLARMDADDISYPSRLEKQVQFLTDHPATGIVTSWSDLIDAAGQVTSTRKDVVSDDMMLSLAASNDIVHGSIMVRRIVLPEEPIYREPPEDYQLWIQLTEEGVPFGCIEEKLYAFRTHEQRYSLVKAHSQSQGIVTLQRSLLERCQASRDIGLSKVRRNLIRGWGTLGGAAWCCGEKETAKVAYRQLLELARRSPEPECRESLAQGYESLIWGGCPWTLALRIRTAQLMRNPLNLVRYKNMLLAIPFIERIRRERSKN